MQVFNEWRGFCLCSFPVRDIAGITQRTIKCCHTASVLYNIFYCNKLSNKKRQILNCIKICLSVVYALLWHVSNAKEGRTALRLFLLFLAEFFLACNCAAVAQDVYSA